MNLGGVEGRAVSEIFRDTMGLSCGGTWKGPVPMAGQCCPEAQVQRLPINRVHIVRRSLEQKHSVGHGKDESQVRMASELP